MGEQRALIDKTLRQQQGKGDPKDGGAQGLAKQQDDLRQKLGRSMQKLGKMGEGLGKAGQAMEQAQRSLNGHDLSNARNAQEHALAEMRAGADALAKQMQGSDLAGQEGQEIDWPGDRWSGAMASKIPDANDLARARDILQELRRRAGERGRPPQELDYIYWLLREFYAANTEREPPKWMRQYAGATDRVSSRDQYKARRVRRPASSMP